MPSWRMRGAPLAKHCRWLLQEEKRARLREAGRRKLDMFKRDRTHLTACTLHAYAVSHLIWITSWLPLGTAWPRLFHARESFTCL